MGGRIGCRIHNFGIAELRGQISERWRPWKVWKDESERKREIPGRDSGKNNCGRLRERPLGILPQKSARYVNSAGGTAAYIYSRKYGDVSLPNQGKDAMHQQIGINGQFLGSRFHRDQRKRSEYSLHLLPSSMIRLEPPRLVAFTDWTILVLINPRAFYFFFGP